jgi:hypothetical protein
MVCSSIVMFNLNSIQQHMVLGNLIRRGNNDRLGKDLNSCLNNL